MTKSFALISVLFLFGFNSFLNAAIITSTATGGVWGNGGTWVGGNVPATGDAVIIATTGAGFVDIGANLTQTAAGSVTVNSGATLTTSAGTITFGALTINSGGVFTVRRSFTVLGVTDITGTINFGSTNGTTRNMTFTGAVILNSGAVWNETTTGAAATFSFGNSFTNNSTSFAAQNTAHNFTGSGMTIDGTTSTVIPTLTFTGAYTNAGTLTVATLLTVTGVTLTNSGTITASTALSGTGGLTQGATGVLNIGGTSGITTLTATAVGNNVNYNGAAQATCKVTTYDNLTLSGSGAKTFATTPTVNGKLSMEGTATVTVTGAGVVTYGPNATLQYNTGTARTSSSEEWITSFAASGGVVIANTGTITLDAAKGFSASVPLTISNGASLNTSAANNYALTFGGDFINNSGTFTANASPVTLTGTMTAQSIAGFTTTGLVSMTKTSGTATFQGNVNGAGLTINGTGGTLNLGSGLSHTFTGDITLTSGTLNGGSSALNENAISATSWNGNGALFSSGTGTVNFGAAEAQTLSATTTTFNNLTFSGSDTKTLTSATTVNGNLSITGTANLYTSTFQISGNLSGLFTMAANTGLTLGNTGNATNVLFPSNYTAGNITLDPASIVTYQAGGAQTVSNVPVYGGLTISGGNTKTINGSASINGVLNLTNGILALGSNDLTLSSSAGTTGTFSATNMIDIGTGSIIKEGNANSDFILTFPIGISSSYTPMQIANFSATTIAPSSTVRVQSSATPASGVPGTHPLNRQWTTSTTGISGSLLADVRFTYLAGDIPAGGTAGLYEIVYKPSTGVWGIPIGASAAGVNPLRASATTTLDATWTGTEPIKRIFYSLKSGSWDDPATWTLDPSGTQSLNPNNVTPTTSPTSAFDEVVVLSGRTVTVPTNTKVNNKLTVVGTLDLGVTTGHAFTLINGTGRIRLAADNFPTGDATDFITAGQGEGTVEYYGTTRTLSVPRTYFNVEVNLTTANTLTLLKDYIINGSLTITSGIFSINDNSSTTALNINVAGNITVAVDGKIVTGTANARHQVNIYGNFTNSGDVRFTNRTVADYANEATDGIVDVNFLSTDKNQSIMCRGITNFYRIEIDKGTDYTYNLDIDATATSNFNLYGYANENHGPLAQLTDNNNALGLVRGSVRIGNSVVIPTLSTANIYSISEGAQLWVDRGTVQKNTGEAIAIYGKLKITNGTLEAKTTSGITFRNNGILSVEGGTINANQIRTSEVGTTNYGGYVQTAGTVNVVGGTTNTDYYVFSLPYTASVFNMSGGTLKVNTSVGNGGILINSDPDNVKVTGGTVIAETNSTEDFLITTTAPFWNFSLENATAVARQFTLGAAANIGPDNVNVAAQPLKVLNDFRIWGKESGGSSYPTVTFITGTNNLYIGGSFYIENGAEYVPVSGGTAPYDAIANQPTARNNTYFYKTAGTGMVEELYQGDVVNPLELGNIVIDRTSGYEVKLTSGVSRTNETVVLDVNGNTSVLSGTLNQNLFTIRTWGAITNNDRMGTWYPGVTPSRAQIQMVENPALTLSTSSNAIFGNVQINVTPPSKITLTSNVYIERMEYVKGLIYLKGYNLKVDNMWNMETGIFENSAVNSYLKVADNSYSGSSMIYTDGKASDGGLTLKISANSQTENQPNTLNNVGPTTFPVGFTPDGGSTLYFRPAQMVVTNYSTSGYITIRPVLGALQTTNQTGGTEVLQHYWRVSHSGFSSLPTVAYRFYYRNQVGTANVDLPTGAVNEAFYVPGKVLDENPFTRQYETLAENDVIKAFGAGGNSRFITFNGTGSTNGLFTPAVIGIALENANYSTGVAARFTGSVLIYYTRDHGINDADGTQHIGNREPRWRDNLTWTRSDILNPAYLPHDCRQPAVAAGNYPQTGDIVQIGWVPWTDIYKDGNSANGGTATDNVNLLGSPHGVWIDGTSETVAEVDFFKMTDASGNPVPRNYRSNFQFRPTLCINAAGGQLVAKIVKGEGMFWNRYSDPNYTQMDIGAFAREDSSYVVYENSAAPGTINNTAPLFPNLLVANDNWGANDKDFTFSKDIVTTGNFEILGNLNYLLPTGITGNITVGRNLLIFEYQGSTGGASGGGAEVDFRNTGTARKIVVYGNLLMRNTNSIIQVRTPNATAPLVENELHVNGNIIQGTSTLASNGLNFWSGANNDRITLYLDGSSNMVYTRANGTIPSLYRVVINKGNSQATTAQFNTDFVLNGPTIGVGVKKALELQNGTFINNNSNAGRILNLTTGNDYFDIPSTAGLDLRLGTARAMGTSGISLDGKLTVSGGILDMSGSDNPIEYSASGTAAISVTSGTITVGGQIRRSPTSDVGILTYSQIAGTVVVGNDAASIGNRGVFEILNAGSSFTMTGGDLYIARMQTSPTISAFYFNPAAYNVGASANIHIGGNTAASTPSGQTIGIYAGQPLPNLRIDNTSTHNPTARLEIVPATINNLLLIDAGATFNANGLDLILKGNITASGTFTPNGNSTFLSGSSTQTITGNGSALNFYNLDKTTSNNVSLNAGNTPLLVNNTLSLRSGTFTDNGNTISVKGDILNNATHFNNGSGDGITLNGTVSQVLTGNGTFGKLTINNLSGITIPVGNQILITGSLKMQAGVLNIGRNLLDIGLNAAIEEASPFSSTNMVETNISFTDDGIRKTFPLGSSPVFTFPMGSGGKYTPVKVTISANGNSTGSLTVKPANEIHPSIVEDTETGTQIVDKDNALQYYWTLKANGITAFSAVAKMRYIDTDAKVTAPYTTADYFTASLLSNGLGTWLKFPNTDFDETNKDLIFNFNLKDDAEISGDYTAGAGDATLNGAIPDFVTNYETNSSGDWTTSTIWTPNVSGGPHGAIVKINTPHTVDVTTNYLSGYMTEIYGALKLYSTFGHRLGIVKGTGTLYLELGDMPAAVYDDFFSSAGGTLEFGGTSDYEFLGNISVVNHLKFSGTGERRFPNNDLILNGDLTISGGAGLNVINYYNRKTSIKGDLTRSSGSFEAGSGANATIAFEGALAQTITGSFSNNNALNNLEINNANDITIINDVEIDRELKLTNGLISVNTGSLFRINYGATVSPSSGSASSFINGVLTKELMNGNSFTFPIGYFSGSKAYGPIALQSVTGPSGINDWKASYFFANATLAGYNTDNFTSPISTVSKSEYWKIEAPTGGASVISIPLDGSSDVASSLSDLSTLRVAGWNATTSKWEVVGTGSTVIGTAISGTITTTATVNYGSYSYFTLASVTPVVASTATITSPAVVSLCSGSSTTITVTFTGTMPYVLTYNVGSTPVTTPAINTSSYNITVSPSVTTIYTLTGITANGVTGAITGTTSATVNVSPIPTVLLSCSPVSPICQSSSITFTATAGLTNYRFRVNGTIVQNGSGNTYTTTSLAVGAQSVDVIGTSSGGCSATSSAIAVTVNPKPAAAGAITGPASVCKDSNGTYTVAAIPNATSYTWSNNNGATGTSITNSITLTFPNSGSTIITVYGVNSCGNGTSSSYTVAVNTASIPDAAGTITGSADVCQNGLAYNYNVAPVTNATSYIWTYSGSGATINGTGNTVTIDFSSGATLGNLTVAGTNGCSTGPVSPIFSIIVNTPPTASIAPVTPATCGGTAILLTATPAGGTAPYTNHAWTGTGAGSLTPNNITNPSFNNITGGLYDLTYTVTDTKGCIGSANTSVTVYQAPVANAGPDALGLCTGTSPIVLTGSTASGSYSGTPTWTGTGGSWTQNPDPALATFTPSTTSGSTTATLTLTGANGCASVSDTRDISWSKAPDQPGAFTESTVTVCQGTSGVTYTVPADPLVVSYNWSYDGTGATINNGTTNSVTIGFNTSATSGTLSVSATNVCGTSATRSISITVNPLPTVTALQTNISCYGASTGAINITAAGGTGPYSYAWTGTGVNPTSEDQNGLSAGLYSVIVSANSCSSASFPVTLTQPAAAVTVTATQTNILCYGASTGAINITAAGGTGAYTYSWTGTGVSAAAEDQSGLAAGNYSVIVTDANGCSSASFPVTLTQPAAAVTVTATQTNILCYGASTGAINITAAGGTGAYTYAWTGAGVSAAAEDQSGLAAGNYSVIVTDANGCSSASFPVTLIQPAAAVTVTATQTNILCYGASTGAINITAAGGTGAYTYSWTGAGVSAAAEDQSGLAAGNYSVIVTDANGCSSASFPVTLTQPAAAVTVTATQTNILCYGASTGAINITAAGGTGAYTYSWTGAGVSAAAEDQSGLAAGNYSVIVTDANGCSSASFPVTLTQPAAAVTVTATQTNILCYGASTGAINITAAGGTGAYTYSWTGAGVSAAAEDQSGLAAGNYSVIVTDANGCSSASFPVTLTQPAAAVTVTATQTNILCYGASTGAINITAAGGTGAYTYSWTGAGVSAAAEDQSGLAAGNYSVIVTDANGCSSASFPVTLTQPAAAVTVTATQTNILCYGASTGAINITAAGGTGAYTYSWTGAGVSAAAEDQSGLAAGNYSVIVTDANGCSSASFPVTLTQPAAAVTVTATQTNILCYGASTGAINITAAGGTGAYTYSWTGAGVNATAEDQSGLAAGNYSVIVTDANGCSSASFPVTLTQPAAAVTVTATQTNILCFGASTGAINITAAGGTGAYTYSWTGAGVSAAAEDQSGLAAGTYSVIVTDANGCSSASFPVTLTQPAAAVTVTATQTNILCYGASTGAINITAAGGTGAYTYSWTGAGVSAAAEDQSGLAAGNYSVIVTDANGCSSASFPVTLTQPAAAVTVTATQTNILCYGASTGAINITAAGGTGAYTYSWTGTGVSAAAEDQSGLAAGNYSVIVTDANGCSSASFPVTLTQPAAAVTVTATQTNILCFGASTGAINITAAGGTGAYTYSWTGTGVSAAAEDQSGLAAGNYSVIVTDANGCSSASFPVTLTQPAAAVTVTATQTNILCYGASTGAINITAAGGTGAYTYSWTGTGVSAAAEDQSGLAAGNYSVIVTDANGCSSASFPVTLTQPAAAVTVTATQTNILCYGASTGAINITAAGGTGAYTYSWTGTGVSAAAEDQSGLAAGNYSVIVTDANGCSSASFPVTLTQPAAAVTVTATQTNILCYGASTGAINITAAGGTGAYTYSWTGTGVSAAAEDQSGLAAGNYSVIVTDANGCSSASFPVTLTQPAAAVTVTATQTNILCFGASTGAINITAAGGTGAYTYSWTGTGVSAAAEDQSGLAAGNYSVIVTDANGCSSASFPVTLTQPAAAVTVTATQTNILCYGASTGAINITAAGGTGAYTYSWTGAGVSAAAEDQSGLAAGNYSVIVTDANGCSSASFPVTLTQPAAAVTVTATQTNILCFGASTGAINITAAGGTGAYTYSWTGAGVSAAAEDQSGLAAGNYSVIVTDANGCSSASFPVTLTQPAAAVTVTATQTNILCYGASTGAINITAAGGTGAYTYAWTGAGVSAAAEDQSGLAAGTYSVIVTDANGCSSASFPVTLTQPAAAVTVTATHTNILCYGASTGAINITAAGGTGAYTYSWTGAGVSAAAEDQSGLAAGNYSVIVTDANGCSSASFPVTLTQPAAAVTVTATQTNILCYGASTGAINITAAGGTGAYTYSWTGAGVNATAEDQSGLAAGNYSVIVTDANGCSSASFPVTLTQPAAAVTVTATQTNILCYGASTGAINITAAGGTGAYTYSWTGTGVNATAEDQSGLAAGTYSVIVTDANGCSSASFPVTLTQPAAAVTVTATQTNILCFGASTGAINITAAGGTGAYTYSWTGAGVSAAAEDQSGLAAGTYSVIVTDANGCSSASFPVTLTQPAAAVTVTATQTNILCYGASTGAINITAAGGTGAYTYSWTGAGVNATAEDQSGLAAGTYSVIVTDANGCSSASFPVTLTQPAAAVTVTATQTNILCYGASTGAINITAAGGTGAYTYSWTGAGVNATAEDQSGLAAGNYSVIVTDANGCSSASFPVTLTQPAAAVTVTATQTNILCYGASTGAINITAAGGTGAYTYSWTGAGVSAAAEDQSGLAAGNYSVIVTDANGCTSASFPVTLTQPAAAVTVTATQTNILCYGASTGAINITAAGGTGAYTYSWTGTGVSAAAEDQSGLAAGNYSVIVTDANGCSSASFPVTLTQPAAAVTVTATHTNILCYGASTGAINITAAGGTGAYTYSWTGTGVSAAAEDQSGLAAGNYSVIVTDANGCSSASFPVTLTQPAAAVTVTATQTNILCYGASTGAINITAAGGTGAYTYSWTGAGVNATAEDQSGLAAGNYSVIVTDANGCSSASFPVTLTQPAAAVTVTATQTNILCYGASTGAINITAAGGTGAYTYSWTGTGVNATAEDQSGLAAGTYSVIVTDANGCSSASFPVTLTQPAAAVTVTATQTNVLCYGASTGAINITAAGGTGAYTYSWTGAGVNATAEDQSGLAAGNYSVIVTDANGCSSASFPVTLTQPAAAVTVTATQTNILCYGASTGAINITAAGGTGAYTYSWTGAGVSAAAEDQSGLAAGNYSVIVTDANGCSSASFPVTLTQPAAAVTVTATQTNILCYGASTGAINITAAGGTGAYTYSWTGAGVNATAEDQSGLAAGTYSVIVTDANGCSSASFPVTLTQPAAAVTVTATHTNILCYGASTGAINITAAGGTGAYTYSWTGAGVNATAEDQSGLAAGTYSVIVTDANGCSSASFPVTLTQPAAAVTVTATQTNILCYGASTGAINITAAGGTGAYTYSWTGTGVNATAEDQSGLAAGTYSVIVTDANGCSSASFPVTLTQPASALTAGLTSQVNVLCNGASTGSAVITPSGGASPYTITPAQTGLNAGLHTFTVTDNNGCSKTVNVTITQPAALTAVLTSQVNVLCNGASTGSVVITPAGGTSPYTITPTQTNLNAGPHTFTVTDANSCTITINVTITQPSVVTGSAAITTAIQCNGGTATVTLTGGGGTAPLSYMFNGVTNGTGVFAGIPAGAAYAWSITDVNLCTPATGTLTVTQPSAVTGSAAITTAIQCNGGTATVTLTGGGGTAALSYTFNGVTNGTGIFAGIPAGAAYAWSITDVRLCTPATGTLTVTQPAIVTAPTVGAITQPSCTVTTGSVVLSGLPSGNWTINPGGITGNTTSTTVSGLSAGTYNYIVTDATGCNSVPSQNVVINLQPVAPTIIISNPAAVCSPATIDLTLASVTAGSTAGLTFTYWTDLAATIPYNTPAAATNGTYYIKGTDGSGCYSIMPVIATVNQSPTITNIQTDVQCFGASNGKIDITAVGGTGPYTYTWTGSVTNPSSEDQTGLAPGPYSVVVTDVNNCTASSSTFTITEPAALSGSIASLTNVSIFGGNNGSVTITATGGVSPYQYKLGSGAYQVSGTFGTLSGGSYIVTVRDINLCTFDVNVTITQPGSLLSGSITAQTNVACYGSSTGSVTVSGSGGLIPYEYKMGAGTYQSSGVFGTLKAGSYVVTVRDASLNTFDVNITISQPSFAVGEVITSQTNVLCAGGNTGIISVSGSGGTAPYKYKIGEGSYQVSGTFANLLAGSYSITVQDANLCTNSIPVTITEPSKLSISSTKQDASCPNITDGKITLTITGGVQPYNVIWSDGIVTLDRPNIVSGTYSVVATDLNGCAASLDIVVGFTNSEKCIEIQEIITPNNDGFYDKWKIKNIDKFPNAEVRVFNRWGICVFSTKNISANEWDGTFKGKLLPTDSYHYVLYLGDGSKAITGTVTIIR